MKKLRDYADANWHVAFASLEREMPDGETWVIARNGDVFEMTDEDGEMVTIGTVEECKATADRIAEWWDEE